MDKIKIVYIDDDPDPDISRYLKKVYIHKEFEKEYSEISFNSSEGYEHLINNNIIKEANIIFIDSKLFQNDMIITGKFSGEEFKMILKKVFPFIEVIVITQNELEDKYGTISKYKDDTEYTPEEYYAKNLKTVIDASIKNIYIYRNIASKLKFNDGIDKVLIEKFTNSLEGSSQYDELTTKDIDDIILAFKELKKEINGE